MSTIQIGDIYRVPLDRDDDVTPKGGASYRNKYCVVVATPEYGYFVAYLLVDHDINLKFNPTRDKIDGFYPITHADYPQIIIPKYDPSWVDTNTIREMEESRMLAMGTPCCRLNSRDFALILDVLRDSEELSPKQKRRMGLI